MPGVVRAVGRKGDRLGVLIVALGRGCERFGLDGLFVVPSCDWRAGLAVEALGADGGAMELRLDGTGRDLGVVTELLNPDVDRDDVVVLGADSCLTGDFVGDYIRQVNLPGVNG